MRLPVTIPLTVAGLCLATAPARGEAFLEFYGGWSSAAADVTGERVASGEKGARSETIDSFVVAGARWRKWFESRPYLGLALDMSYFDQPGDRLDVGVLSFSIMGMARYGFLKSETYPNGRLQPYAGLGLGFFTGSANADLRPDVAAPVSGSGGGAGLDSRFGLSWFLTPKTALFSEFRYAAFSMNLDKESYFLVWNTGEVVETLDADMSVRQVLVGVSFRL